MANRLLDIAVQTVKVCKRCGETKPTSEFHIRRESGRPRSECIPCYRAGRTEARDPLDNRRRVKEWQKANPEQRRRQSRGTYRRSRLTLDGCLRRTISSKRAACRKAGIEFAITASDITRLFEKQGGICALTGRQLLWGVSGCPADTLSIDRIDQAGGYTPGNIRLITYQANFSRNKYSDDELLRFCFDVVRHLKRAA